MAWKNIFREIPQKNIFWKSTPADIFENIF